MRYYVYTLKCQYGFYTGCTSNIKKRIRMHNKGLVLSTIDRRPVSLNFYVVFDNKRRAFKFEKYLKSGSGRAFIKRHLM